MKYSTQHVLRHWIKKMEPPKRKIKPSKEKLQRCMSWIEEQNGGSGASGLSAKPFDADNFVETFKSEPSSVPPGIDGEVDAVAVPVNRLRTDHLRMECGWRGCGMLLMNYGRFISHVLTHMPSTSSLGDQSPAHYECLWDSCGHTTADYEQLLRHVNYHSYHARLLAIGLNARPSLHLKRCKKDSRQRNKIPKLLSKHVCLWIDCTATFNSMPEFVAHMGLHAQHEAEHRCRWAGCGARAGRRCLLGVHLRVHTNERAAACYHCGQHFANYYKLTEHVQRQNAENTGLVCNVCGASAGSPALLRRHEQAHIAMHACLYCDMSLPTVHTLAAHMRQRHSDARPYPCHLCPYKSKTKPDLRSHVEIHKRKEKQREKELRRANREEAASECSSESEPLSAVARRQPRGRRRYCCHMCAAPRLYSRGSRLTTHLVREHGIQLPFGHPRFRYQISDDGMYRLTTTRYESLEVSQKIMERQAMRRPVDSNTIDVKITEIVEATHDHPKQIVLAIHNKAQEHSSDSTITQNNVQITMCDVDEFGNLIKQKFLDSDQVIFDDTDYNNINQY